MPVIQNYLFDFVLALDSYLQYMILWYNLIVKRLLLFILLIRIQPSNALEEVRLHASKLPLKRSVLIHTVSS